MIPTYRSLLNLFIIGNNEKEEQVQENKTKHEWKNSFKLYCSCAPQLSETFIFVDGGVGLVWLHLALTSVKPFMFLLWILGHCQGDWKRMWRKFKCGSVKGRGEYWLAGLPFGETQLCPEHWSSTQPLVPKETMWVYTFISMLRP